MQELFLLPPACLSSTLLARHNCQTGRSLLLIHSLLLLLGDPLVVRHSFAPILRCREGLIAGLLNEGQLPVLVLVVPDAIVLLCCSRNLGTVLGIILHAIDAESCLTAWFLASITALNCDIYMPFFQLLHERASIFKSIMFKVFFVGQV